MIQDQTLEERVADHYGDLSTQLQKAADFVVTHPLDIATRSLRSISADSNVSPATFSRLARALGFASFEEMKDTSRMALELHVPSLSEKAQELRSLGQSETSILKHQSNACIQNIKTFVAKADEAKLDAAAESLCRANTVMLVGALGSTGIVEYMAYLANYFSPNWVLAGRAGASLGAQIVRLGTGDTVFIVTKAPYVRHGVAAARLARDNGCDVILVTDSHKCPALQYATYSFFLPSDSPQFFSSYAATLVLIEALIAMVVAKSEADAITSIRKVEDKNQELGDYWTE